jgi:aspartyl aminopeptidase
MQEFTWETYNEEKFEKVMAYAEGYKAYLSNGKTERECVDESVKLVKAKGYYDLNDVIANNIPLKKGDGVYAVNMNKVLAVFRIGEDVCDGMNILGAHIDSPRMDIKANPLYESDGFAYLDTHYYGGIKKYQWTTIPLAIHGVVCKKDGSSVTINIGERDDEPVFGVTELLIHLSQELMKKNASVVIEGEMLDILVGSTPLKGEKKDSVKAWVLKFLKDTYGIEEEDFLSAELEVVPAGKARDFGFDRAMVYGYGHDDRVCAYASLTALLEAEELEKTSVCILVDKEEVGSNGATGMHSLFFENCVTEILNACGVYSELNVRRTLAKSKMLSSDVAAGFDPTFASTFDKKNAAYLGHGICFMKFTGGGGKRSANDANPEYLAYVRKVLDDAEVIYQTAEIGRVDLGGGGTIAYILAKYNMEVVDCGIPVLNMHAPWELVSKADIYEGYLAYQAFLKGSK